jgi:predicted GNAT family N-acyltransferase
MAIRKLKLDDYQEFLCLINDFIETYFTQEDFKKILETASNKEIWVYEFDNKLLATASIIYETKFIFNICKSALIEDVCTKKEFRNKGYGKKIIEHLISEASYHNCYKINLVCNSNLIPFYKSSGFEQRGVHLSILIKKPI